MNKEHYQKDGIIFNRIISALEDNNEPELKAAALDWVKIGKTFGVWQHTKGRLTKESMRELGFACRESGGYQASANFFDDAGDLEELRKTLELAVEKDFFVGTKLFVRAGLEDLFIDNFLEEYPYDRLWSVLRDKGLGQSYRKDKKNYCEKFGFEFKFGGASELCDVLVNADALHQTYDVGVVLARGGLDQGYGFNLYGMDLLIARPKRRGRGATWKWITDEEEVTSKLKDKRVLVLEDDVDTGRTLKRAAREIQMFDPSELSVCFGRTLDGHEGIASVPKMYSKVYTPFDFGYKNIARATHKLIAYLEKIKD